MKVHWNMKDSKSMKYLSWLFIVFLIYGCDHQGYYTFTIKNESSKEIELRFLNEQYNYNSDEYPDTINISTEEERVVRVVYAPLNSPVHDCLSEHGMAYFEEIIFDTYVEGKKIEKQLWQPQNWTYNELGEWEAEYNMTIDDEMILK